MGQLRGHDYALGIIVLGVVFSVGGLWTNAFYQPALFTGLFIVAGIAIGGSYIGAGAVGVASGVVDTGLLPIVAAGMGVLIGFGSVEIVFDPPSGDRVWLLLGLALLNGQILLGTTISEQEQLVAFVAESVAVFVLAFSYLSANTSTTNIASFLTVSTITTLIFAIFGWPLYRLGVVPDVELRNWSIRSSM